MKHYAPLLAVALCSILCATSALWLSLRRVPLSDIHATVRDGKGVLWAATEHGLFQQNSDGQMEIKAVPSLTRHPYPSIHAMAYDSLQQRLYIGAWNKIYCYDVKADRFLELGDTSIYQTVALNVSKDGQLFAKTRHGLYRLSSSKAGSRTERLDTQCYNKTTVEHNFPKLYHKSRPTLYKNTLAALSVLLFLFAIVIILYVMRAKKTAKEHLANLDTTEPSKELTSAFAVKAQSVVENHFHEPDFCAESFASEMGVSRAQLFRKLKAECGQTVNAMLTECRMRHAALLLKDERQTVLSIALSVGYSDASSFRRAFVHYYGITPSQFVSKLQPH